MYRLRSGFHCPCYDDLWLGTLQPMAAAGRSVPDPNADFRITDHEGPTRVDSSLAPRRGAFWLLPASASDRRHPPHPARFRRAVPGRRGSARAVPRHISNSRRPRKGSPRMPWSQPRRLDPAPARTWLSRAAQARRGLSQRPRRADPAGVAPAVPDHQRQPCRRTSCLQAPGRRGPRRTSSAISRLSSATLARICGRAAAPLSSVFELCFAPRWLPLQPRKTPPARGRRA